MSHGVVIKLLQVQLKENVNLKLKKENIMLKNISKKIRLSINGFFNCVMFFVAFGFD